MTSPGRDWLIAAAALDGIAALLHLGCIVGGPPWYRFFGAGERIARMAEFGSWRPGIYAFAIAAMLSVWGLYALSGAGVIGRLALLRTALATITLIYLARAAALPLMLSYMLTGARRSFGGARRSCSATAWSTASACIGRGRR